MRYRVAGAESLASVLNRDGASACSESVLYRLGLLLHGIHRCRVPATSARPPQALRRLTDWLDGTDATPYAEYAATELYSIIGARRWSVLREWCAGVAAEADVRIAHGAPGLGRLVIGAQQDTVELLTGEELSLAPWYFDLGWTLGELIELKWYYEGNSADWQRLADALLRGYGDSIGDAWAGMATIRIAVHLHDYTVYVGRHGELFRRYAELLTSLIDFGRAGGSGNKLKP